MIAEFEKIGRMAWFSHLDLQSTMQRALRRANLPVRYSQGYNPHVNLSFAAALPVGCQSVAEILDVELEEGAEVAPEHFVDALNQALPLGLKLRRARLVPDSFKALMASMTHAQYTVTVPGVDMGPAAEAFMASESCMAEKRSKTKTRSVDIRPMVFEMTCAFDGTDSVLTLTLEHNNANCLKPELLLSALAPDAFARIMRTAFLTTVDGERVSLFTSGAEGGHA